MTAAYGSEALRGYADDQLRRAQVQLIKHAEAAFDLCRCGRLHPCDDHRYWAWVREHYTGVTEASRAGRLR